MTCANSILPIFHTTQFFRIHGEMMNTSSPTVTTGAVKSLLDLGKLLGAVKWLFVKVGSIYG